MASVLKRGKSTNRSRRTGGFCIENLELRVLLSTATFASPVTTQIITGIFPTVSTASADLNGDGIPDLVVDRSNLTAQVFLGTANGAFILSNIYPAGGTSIALGDFNGDGNMDLLTADGVLLGDGSGAFGTAVAGFTLPPNTVNLYAEDILGTGDDDLIASTFVNGTGTGAMANPVMGLVVMLGNGDGTFKTPITINVGTSANITTADASFAFGDFNNDGILDVVTPFGVMFGNSTGTFGSPIPLPFTTPGSSTPALPTQPLFAVGDFNGDQNLDIATLGAVSNPGNVEIFLGTGKGTFTDNGSVLIGTEDTITSLAAGNLTNGASDSLAAGIITTSGNPEIAVLSTSGSAVFSAASLYAIGGPSVGLTMSDQNDDGNLDLLSIDQPLGGTGTGTILDAVSASVLFNSPVVLPSATLGLRGSPSPVVQGSPVSFTATVRPPANSSVTAIPKGNVTFMDGSISLGTATLVKGKASVLDTDTSVLGLHSITFAYSGDSNYATTTSAPFIETVLQTTAKELLVVPTNISSTLPSEFLPGDKGTVSVTLTNGGAKAGTVKLGVNVSLSTDGMIDSSAIALSIPGLLNRTVTLASGHSVTLTGHVTALTYAPANYYLVAQAVAVNAADSSKVNPAPLDSATTFQAAGMVFGTIGKHKGVKRTVTDSALNPATFTLTGPGMGTITQTAGATDLVVSGTSPASRLTISSPGAFILDDVRVAGTLGSFVGKLVTLAGDMRIGGGIKQLTLGSVASGDGSPLSITIGPALPVTASLGSVGNATFTSAAKIAKLTASFWQAGGIDAPSIANLIVPGAFSANVRIHAAGKLQTARLGSVTGGIWAVAGGIGMLRISGALSGASIYAGADTGPDDSLGTADDIFAAATIASLFVGGPDTSSLVVAGAASFVTGTMTTGLVLFPKGHLLSVSVNGAVSDDSRFLATHLPRLATLAGVKVATVSDPHFQP